MANEVTVPHDTGRNVYMMVVSATGTFWNTSGTPALEVYNGSNITDYDIALSELGTASGLYQGSMPAVAVGVYTLVICERTGASPAQTDAKIAIGQVYWNGSALIYFSSNWNALVIDSAGCVDASVEKWDDVAVASQDTTGYPVVTIKDGTGTGELALVSGVVDANVLQISGDATAADNLELFFDGAFVAGSVNDAGAAAGDFDGDAGLSATNDFYNGSVLNFTSGTLKGIARKITDYVGASKNFSFTVPFPAAPSNADTFIITGRIDG